MLGKWRLAAAAVSAMVLLFGCATQAEIQAQKEAEIQRVSRYDTAHSYAWNLGKFIAAEREIKDAFVDDKKLVNNPTDITNMQVWSVANAIEWNPLSVGSLLLMFGPEAPNVLKTTAYIGFLPKKDYPSEYDARAKFRLEVVKAWMRAASKLGYTKEHQFSDVKKLRMVKPDDDKEMVLVDLQIIYPKHAISMRLPKWIDPNGEEVWAIGVAPAAPYYSEDVVVLHGGLFDLGHEALAYVQQTRTDLHKILASELPDNYFVYVPSLRDKEQRRPPYFANNKQRFDFVMPKSAEPKK